MFGKEFCQQGRNFKWKFLATLDFLLKEGDSYTPSL